MTHALGLLWVGLVSIPYVTLWPEVLLPISEKVTPDILWRGRRDTRAIALTFDDGPDPVYTPQVLDTLAQNGIHATFFLVGERARQYPELVARIRAAGHEIGNHTDSWRSTRWVKPADFEQDLLRAENSLDLQNVTPKYLRPAGGVIGRKQARTARDHGYQLVLASMPPFDSHLPPAGWIVALVKRSLRPGAIIVLHDAGGDRSRTVAALPRIIAAARARGLGFATISAIDQP